MIQLKVPSIYDYVKSKLDELSNNEDAMLVANDESVEDLEKEIYGSIIPAVRKIHLDAPNVLLKDCGMLQVKEDACYFEPVEPAPEAEVSASHSLLIFPHTGGMKNISVSAEQNTSWVVSVQPGTPSLVYDNKQMYKYIIPLPRDFMRLVSLQMSDWERPIQTLFNEDSAEYHKQQNKFLRGTPKRPVGILLRHSGDELPLLELYSCQSNTAILANSRYVPEPAIKTSASGSYKYVNVCEPLYYPCLNQITAEVLRSIGDTQGAVVYDQLAVKPFYIDPDYARANPVTGERINTNQ
jgi:hypothetical protein